MVSHVKLVRMVNGVESRISACVKDDDIYTDLCNILLKCFSDLLDLGLKEYSDVSVKNSIVTFMYKIAYYAGKQGIEMLDLFIVLRIFFKKAIWLKN